MFRTHTAVLFLAGATVTAAALAQTPPSAAPAPSRGRSVTVRRIPSRSWLGVGLGELTPERAKALKLSSDAGVEVTHIDESSPASRAGLKEGDVITGVDGEKVTGGDRFARTIGEETPGSKINLEVWRGGAKQTITATLEVRPMQFVTAGPWPSVPATPAAPFEGFSGGPFSVMPGESPRIGFEGETLTPQLAQFFGVKEGVLVRTVTPKTPAEKAGLKAGDVIFKVSGTPVSSPREISGLVHYGHQAATFTVMRNHKEIVLNVQIAGDRVPAPDREVL
ncbi:MAG: PDZ domain-containing protein [Terriglobia bacterium]